MQGVEKPSQEDIIQALQAEIKLLRAELEHLQAVVRVYRPNINEQRLFGQFTSVNEQ